MIDLPTGEVGSASPVVSTDPLLYRIAGKCPDLQLQFDLQPNICKKMRGARNMITSGYELSRECIKEIELQINQRLFEAGVISSDMYKLAKEKIVDGE